MSQLEIPGSSTAHDFAELAEGHRIAMMELSRDEHGVALAFEAQDGVGARRRL